MSRYDWDPKKAALNAIVHGVSFDEAETVTEGPLARFLPDETHLVLEQRFMLVGYSDQGRLLVVITSEGGPRPRIISARRATKRERNAYEDRP